MSVEKFVVGEIAVFVRPGSKYYGTEVTVRSELKLFNCEDRRNPDSPRELCLAYAVAGFFDEPPRGGWVAPPEYLRKKRPPREDLKVGRWDECPWQPAKMTT